jgi:GAF domain-containing protein/HAMP domain-containing protein
MTSELQQKQNAASVNEDVRRRDNALRISLVMAIVLAPINLLYIYLLTQTQTWQIYTTAGVSLSLTILAVIANRLSRSGRAAHGMISLMIWIAIIVPASSAAVKDLGLVIGISGFAAIALIAGLTQNPRSMGWPIAVGAVSGIAAILIDLYAQHERLELEVIQTVAPAVIVIILLTYTTFILREFANYPLRTKLVLAFVLTAVLSLGTLAIIVNRTNNRQLIENFGERMTAETEARALITGDTLARELQGLQALGFNKAIQDYVELANFAPYAGRSSATIQAEIQALDEEWRAADIANTDNIPLIDSVINNEISRELREYRSAYPENVEIFVTDSFGANISATNRTSDYYQADERWWQAAYNDGQGGVFIGEPTFDTSSNTYAIIIAIPVYAHDTTKIVGVLRTTLDVEIILSILDAAKLGETGQIKLYLADGRRVPVGEGESTFGERNAILGLPLDTASYIDSTYDDVPSLISRAAVTSTDKRAAPIINQLRWSLVSNQDRSEVLLQAREQARTITFTSMILLGLVALTAFFASQFIARPLQSLTAVAEQITEGDLNIRAAIATQDEIGTLANSFNRMTDNLRETLVDLERRVAERTADLEIARHQSEKRASELLSIGEISKLITSEQKLEYLLTLITRLVSERFGFYHTGIFLLDETGQYAVLQAANSEGGRKMLDRAHKLEVGGGGIVGHVAKFGTSRIALDVGLDAVFFNNPDLPNTRSEMAIPLKVRETTIGVLDVQSDRPGAFGEDDANTLSILADQIAIAIENARLFTQTQQSLDELQALYRQNLHEGWVTFSREESMVGYQQSLTGGRKLTKTVESDEIQQAVNRGESLVFHADGSTQESTIVIPIKLRGQIIGAMNVKAPTKDRQWSANEIGLAEAISERLSLALENARLIQESQRQVIKEQTISEVTGKISASINLKNVLQTAVEELGRSMPGSEVIIQFQDENVDEDGK